MKDLNYRIAPEVLKAFGEWFDRLNALSQPEREANLADTLQLYHDLFRALMSEWANQPVFSDSSDRLDAYMDDIRAKIMDLLPLIIKTLRGMDTPADPKRNRSKRVSEKQQTNYELEIGAVLIRVREQEAKWGLQQHTPEKWLAILGEEFGEVSKAVNEHRDDALIYELVDLAAVCVSALRMHSAWRNDTPPAANPTAQE